jgi:peptidoglycan hydrolase-like protein with peptidoglycan-binding domain
MLTRNGAVLAIALLALSSFSAAAALTVSVPGELNAIVPSAVTASNTASSTASIVALQPLVATLESELNALIAGRASSGTSTTSVAVTFTHTLTFGDEGTDVSALQQILENAGFYIYPTITGYFGTYTWRAVAAFQWAYGLDSVGYVGPKTRALLNGVAGALASGSAAQPAATSPNASSPATGTTNTTPSSLNTTPLFPIAAGYGGGGGNTTPPTTNATPSQAAPTLSVTNSPVTYTGSAQAATVTGSVAGTVSSVR